MAVAFVGVVELVCIRDLCEEGTGVFGERVEIESVDDNGEGLVTLVSPSLTPIDHRAHGMPPSSPRRENLAGRRVRTYIDETSTKHEAQPYCQISQTESHLYTVDPASLWGDERSEDAKGGETAAQARPRGTLIL